MAIKHSTIKISGQRGYAADWNADHVIDEGSKALRGNTIIVCASDSLDTGRADYICDGVNDEVQINDALTDASAKNGSVLLLEGTYYLDDVVNIPTDTTLKGVGWGSILRINKGSKSYLITLGTRSTIRDLKFDGVFIGDWVFQDANYTKVSFINVWFNGTITWFGPGNRTLCKWLDNYWTAGAIVGGDYSWHDTMTECIIIRNLFDVTSGKIWYVNTSLTDSIFTSNIYKGATSYFQATSNSITTGNIS